MKCVRIDRLSLTAILAAMACLLLAVSSARGQGFTLQVSENANSVLNLLNGAPHPGFLLLDPGPGGLPNALTFTTPAGLVVGDLLLHEPGGAESDLIRWNANGTLVFYSDNSDADIDPITGLPVHDDADLGLPGAAYPNGISAIETGLFGADYSEFGTNGLVYVPLPGQPGFNPNSGGSQPTYIFISDVPEPGTLTLVGLSLAGALAVIRRKK